MTRKLVLTGAIFGLLALILFQSVSGFIGRNTFNDTGYIDRSGRLIWVTAEITCTRGERLDVEARLSQERVKDNGTRVGAFAEGRAQAVCTSDDPDNEENFQEVKILAVTRGWETFVPGQVVATGLATTRERGRVTGVRQWQPDDGIELVSTK